MASSQALREWRGERSARLDAIEKVLRRVGAGSRRDFTTQQMNPGYAILLAAQFQRYCADLHAECVGLMFEEVPSNRKRIVVSNCIQGRQLDKGNAQPGSLGNDFGRLGIQLWPELKRWNPRVAAFQTLLAQLNAWRNAIAHDDFSDAMRFPQGNSTTLQLDLVRKWRTACNRIALGLDIVMRDYILSLKGVKPW